MFTSALAAADLLTGSLEPGARVLACAGPGVIEALGAAGFTVVHEPPAAAVVVGFHRDFDFDGLDRAARAVREGARFVATNLDATYPVAGGGLLPGTGAIVAAVATATGRQPEVAGKPCPPTVALVRRRLGDHGLVVGDRPSTDGALADALGWPFALGAVGRDRRGRPARGRGDPRPAAPVRRRRPRGARPGDRRLALDALSGPTGAAGSGPETGPPAGNLRRRRAPGGGTGCPDRSGVPWVGGSVGRGLPRVVGVRCREWS